MAHNSYELNFQNCGQHEGFPLCTDESLIFLKFLCLEALLNRKDVYASLPTRYGKSLIFYAVPIVADELFILQPHGSSKKSTFLI